VTTVDTAVFAFVVVVCARVAVLTAVLLASVVALGAIVADVRCCENVCWGTDFTLLDAADIGFVMVVLFMIVFTINILLGLVVVRLLVAVFLAVLIMMLAIVAALWF
jgi:hypothetical protein